MGIEGGDFTRFLTPGESDTIRQFLENNGGVEWMQRLPTREVRANLSDTIMRAAFWAKATIITHHWRKYAAMVPIEVADIISGAIKRMKAAWEGK